MLVKSTSTTVKSILHEAGLLVDVVYFDGSIHRVPTIDKPTQKDGSYIAYADAPISI